MIDARWFRILGRTLPITVAIVTFAGCSSSKDDVELGQLEGWVDQALFPGVPPLEGDTVRPSISPMIGITVLITDSTSSTVVDSAVSNEKGYFEIRLPHGSYLASPSIPENSDIPIMAPAPVPFRIGEGADAVVRIRYNIYAP